MENQSNARGLMSHEKLRSIKGSIKQWHSNIKINDHNKRLEALNDLKVIDNKIDDGSANENDRENRIKLLQDIGNLDNLEGHDLIQKARIKWDIEGEETPIFFMGLLTKRGDPNLLPVLCTMALGLQTRLELRTLSLISLKKNFKPTILRLCFLHWFTLLAFA
nr:RNA-directed DNA polymerase, eukaryota, reverse transcriptase zinc-binding domain protein [Tanacetum cinerariifolium]